MAFHEVRFPASISFGSSGGIERRTEIVTLANGHEERNSPWSQSRDERSGRKLPAGIKLVGQLFPQFLLVNTGHVELTHLLFERHARQ